MQARHRLQQVRSMGMYQTMVPWLPVAVGIGIMVGFMVYAVALQSPSQPAFDAPAGAGPAYPPAPAAASPTPSAAATDPPEESPPPTEPPPPATPPEPPPPPPDVTGKYVLKELFGDSFVAKVVIINELHDPQHWRVTLEYPDSVGDLIEFWVDGAQQPDLDRSHDTFLFTSAEPVDARSQVVLKVHFERDGADVTPEVCEVNGVHCRL